MTDAAGRFHLQGIATGDYKVFARDDAENGAWFDPEFLRLYEDRGQAARFSEGSKENLQVTVIPPRL